MFPASIPSDPLTLLAALFTLFGLPLLIFGSVLFYAGYIRHNADQELAALEEPPNSNESTETTESARPADQETSTEPDDAESTNSIDTDPTANSESPDSSGDR